MPRNILLVEPNYTNKFPPIALMKLSTYHKRLGDNVVFYKGEFKDFIVNRIADKCLDKLNEIEPGVEWAYKKHFIADYIKTRKCSCIEALDLEELESKELIVIWLTYFKDYFWNKEYEKEDEREWDRIFITTLFTFYYDITIKCINEFKTIIKPNGLLMVGGVLATLQPEEIKRDTGIEPFQGLLNKPHDLDPDNDLIIDSIALDYTILEEIDYKYEMSNAYYGSTTKGCIRKCKFCAVPKLEPVYIPFIPLKERVDAVHELCGEQRDLLLMDNNVMASKDFDAVIEEIISCGFGAGATWVEPDMLAIAVRNLHNGVNDRGYIKRARSEMMSFLESIKDEGVSYTVYRAMMDAHLLRQDTATKEGIFEAYEVIKPYWELSLRKRRPSARRVDFNQGVDARLFNEHIAKQFARIAINPLRIAFDNLEIKDKYVEAIKICQREGLRQYSNYLLYNFKDKPVDLYQRLEINTRLCEELDVNIYSFPMKYHPLYGEHSHDRNFIGEFWNMKQVRSVQAILNVTKGCIGRGESLFYRAFGRNEREFLDILMMPDTMVLYRFFFEWLETKKHPLSKYRWQELFDALSNDERDKVEELLSLDTAKRNFRNYSDKIQKLEPFYANLRNDIQDEGGKLFDLKKEFDSIPKKERDDVLEKMRNSMN